MFEQFDKNKDGKVDKEEVLAAMGPLCAKMKAKAFKWNATAKTTQAEFKAMVK